MAIEVPGRRTGSLTAAIVDGYSSATFLPAAFLSRGIEVVHVPSSAELRAAMIPPDLTEYVANITCPGPDAVPATLRTPGGEVASTDRDLKDRGMSDFSITFFGTSIMEHLEAHAAVFDRPGVLPGIGQSVVIDSHRRRGWVHMLFLGLQAQLPGVRFSFDNQGLGGATSRDVLQIARTAIAADASGPDLAVLGVGINDVWRYFQNRPDQAVDLAEYRSNYGSLLSALSGWAGQVLCVTETPFGWDDTLDVAAMNKQLSEYNAASAMIARQRGIPVTDLWQPVLAASRQLSSSLSPWSDGVHLSELGDMIVARQIETAVMALLDAHRRTARPQTQDPRPQPLQNLP